MKAAETGLRTTIRKLNNLSDKLKNPAPLAYQIGQMLSNSAVERFHTATDPQGKPWKRLKPATILRKGHDKKLVDTGSLINSITFSANKSEIMVYSTDPNQDKVKAHQSGNPKRNLPRRAIFGISKQDEEDIHNLVLVWMESAL